jgi:ribosome biogenesis protein MAK21
MSFLHSLICFILLALVLSVQQSPIHNLSKLDQLVQMSMKVGKRESEISLDAVKDLFVNTLLPDRKLSDFKKNPWIAVGNASISHLLLVEFESQLKKLYAKFVQAIEESTIKGLPHIKRCKFIIESLYSSLRRVYIKNNLCH